MTRGQVAALDSKIARGSQESANGKNAFYLVSAWASENGILLSQRKVAEKSNEMTAISALLEQFSLTGCIVTIDAMGCQAQR